jgi:catechol 2,3-dioxygenase-like lactoylglutathione lyase family enzyme
VKALGGVAPGGDGGYLPPVSSPSGRPPALGLRHVALRVRDLPAAEDFFVRLLGYEVEWRPDPENVYLTRGDDNLALHRGDAGGPGALDHLGIFVPRAEDVDAWERWLEGAGATLKARPRTHRDGTRSLYVAGPEGIVVQLIHHPRAPAG